MDEEESCYFHLQAKNECSIKHESCTGTRSSQLCTFRKTYKEYFESRNEAVMANRAKGRCCRCKYKTTPCEIIEIGEEKV